MHFNPYDYKTDYHRRIKAESAYKMISFIKEFNPKTEIERRDLKILQYAFIDGLSASAIYRKNDQDIVGFGNRNKSQPLSVVSICRIINKYSAGINVRRLTSKKPKRVELMRKREIYPSKHIKMCAFCGGKENLEEHHMIPLCMGGDNDELNLVYLCHNCHRQVTNYHSLIKKI